LAGFVRNYTRPIQPARIGFPKRATGNESFTAGKTAARVAHNIFEFITSFLITALFWKFALAFAC